MRFDWSRLPRALALLAWAAFFDWLWLTDGAGRYVGPRTSWVVPFGGIVLTLAALLYLRSLRRSQGHGAPSVRELLGTVALLVPLVLVAAAPASSLGSLSVERKRSSGNRVALPLATASSGAAITLYDLNLAATSAEFARERGIEDGTAVTFDGFVSRAPEGGAFEVSRFLATCCAADAIPYSVQVRLDAETIALERDQWVRVTGRVSGEGDALEVRADRVDPTAPPSNPYSYGT